MDASPPESGESYEALRRELARLQGELRERDDVLALAAHELRNPLHELSLRLALIRALTQSQADVTAHVAKAQASLASYSQRATLLLQLVSSSQGAAYPLVARPVDLAQTLAQLAERLQVQAQARDIVLRTDLPSTCAAVTDATVVEQVVDNLLLNAFKHSLCSEVRISLQAQDGWARVQVADDGRGIAPHMRERIFQKFASSADSSLGEHGSGLGLWIVRRLATALGGNISLDTAAPTGACFDLRFPLTIDSVDSIP